MSYLFHWPFLLMFLVSARVSCWAVISCEWHWIFRTHPWVLWARVSMIFLDNRNPWLQLPVTVPFSLNWFHIVTFYSLTIEEAYKDFIGRELAGCFQVTFSIQNFSHGSVDGQKTTLLLTVRHLLAVYPSHDWWDVQRSIGGSSRKS